MHIFGADILSIYFHLLFLRQVNSHATNQENPAHAHMQQQLAHGHQAHIGMPGGLGGNGLAAGRGRGFPAALANLLEGGVLGLGGLGGGFGWGEGGAGGVPVYL